MKQKKKEVERINSELLILTKVFERTGLTLD